ncbi:MAG: glycine--tRNA ligase [Candidatus Norongarragalinales archaeon]
MSQAQGKIDKVVNLCSRRGLVFPNSEIYSPLGGFFDYAHYGLAIKKRIASAWWDYFVKQREDVVGLDGSIISSPKVWKASGHLENFTDPLVECKKCKSRFRADQLVRDELKLEVEGLDEKTLAKLISEHKLVCEKCRGELAEAKTFNLMFKTQVGVIEDDANAVFLRPETAQTIFADFKSIAGFARKKLPFGIAQIGKAFRNEISPRNFLFRAREFEQMELEFFLHPNKSPRFDKIKLNQKIKVFTARAQSQKSGLVEKSVEKLFEEKIVSNEWLVYWLAEAWFFLTEELGLKKENLRMRQHVATELSHYSKETWDVEYDYPEWGWKELVGIANRGDFDLQQHQKHSGKDLSVFDEESKQKVLPTVIEPSFGLDRLFFTVLIDSFEEEGEKTVLKLERRIAPLDCAVFPLMAKDGLDEKAREVFEMLKHLGLECEYDERGSIGKRYARMDEIGVPLCITVDYDSLEKNDCTVRYRDSGKQERVLITLLPEKLHSA